MLNTPIYLMSYREFTTMLGLPFYSSSRDRRKQELYLKNFFDFERDGQGYHIKAQLKQYTPPPKSSRITTAQTKMEIETQLLHAIAEQKIKGGFTPSARGLANEVTLTLASAYELVGLAVPGWNKLKEGNLDFEATSSQQRKAYFEHHDVCFSKWKRAVASLEKHNLIKRTPWYSVVEAYQVGATTKTRVRLITEMELGDCIAIDANSLAILEARHQPLKFEKRSDVWLRFMEEEYLAIRRGEIKKANSKHRIMQHATTWLDTFPVSRFIFTPMMEEAWEKYLKRDDDIQQLKTQLTLKMVDWYKLPQNDSKYENVKLCLAYILGEDYD